MLKSERIKILNRKDSALFIYRDFRFVTYSYFIIDEGIRISILQTLDFHVFKYSFSSVLFKQLIVYNLKYTFLHWFSKTEKLNLFGIKFFMETVE